MKFNKIIDEILNSEIEDWNKLSSDNGPLNAKNLYLGEEEKLVSAHDYIYIFKPNVNISIGEGLIDEDYKERRDANIERNNEYLESWEDKSWNNAHTEIAFLDLMWSGNVIHRCSFAVVDSARGYIPLPAGWSNKVEKLDYHLTRLITELNEHTDFDTYFNESGLEIR